MTKRDYYEILGLARGAGEDELKKAYRRLAIEFHPDRNPGDSQAETRFKEINEAYQVLSDPKKRAAYDQFGHAGLGGGGFGGFEGGFTGSFSDIFDNLFSDIFGGGGQSGGGVDLRYQMDLTFEEAAFGVEKTITFEKESTCGTCSGTGAKPGTSLKKCQTCRGSGQLNFNQGFFTLSRTCSACMGRGAVIEQRCYDCGGKGRTRQPHSVKVNIPAGIDSEQRLRLRGEGEVSEPGGRPGDLFVLVQVQEHPLFRREAEHIVLDLPISFVQAALGEKVTIPTLEGTTEISIPAGTQTGEVIKLKHKGIKRLNGSGFGDMMVRVLVETPSRLTSRQKELLREFASEESRGSHPAVERFIGKLKDLWK